MNIELSKVRKIIKDEERGIYGKCFKHHAPADKCTCLGKRKLLQKLYDVLLNPHSPHNLLEIKKENDEKP